MTFSGPGAQEAAAALAAGLEELGAPPRQPLEVAPDPGQRDPIAALTLVLTIPPAILATWDLADRIGKLEAVQRWLGRAPGGAKIVASGASGRSVELGPGKGAELLEVANQEPLEPAWDLFLSYAGPDQALALELHGALAALGVLTFVDRRGLGGGESWGAALRNAQAASRGTLVLISPGFESAWYQDEEIQRAVQLARGWQRLLIPLYRDGRPSSPREVPYGLYRLEPLDLVSAGGVRGAARQVRVLLEARG